MVGVIVAIAIAVCIVMAVFDCKEDRQFRKAGRIVLREKRRIRT